MTQEEYFKYALKKQLYKKKTWIYSMFSQLLSSTEYVRVDNGKYYVITDTGEFELKLTKNNMLLDTTLEINLTNDNLINIDTKVKTTLGVAVLNAILLVFPFKNKINYVDDMFKFDTVYRNNIVTRLTNEESSDTKITNKEYINFGIAVTMIRSVSPLFVISSTEKAILPPKGIDAFKAKTIKEFKTKYGEKCFDDKVHIVELENKLKEYDREWLKDDPSFGISLTPKILNTSRKKRYLMFGAENGITDNDETIMVENSLLDGYPTDKKQLASMFNTARSASYSRGKETQTSGVISDRLIRAFTGFKTVSKDCGTNTTLSFEVTKSNYINLIGRYYVVNKKVNIVDTDIDAKKLIGTTIELRSMRFCKSKSITFCKVCAGRYASMNDNGIVMVSLDIGAEAMKSNLKKMHSSSLAILELTLNDLIK